MSAEIMLPGREEVTLLSPVSRTKLKYFRQRLGGHTWKNLCELIPQLCCQQFLYFINIGDSVCFLQLADFFVDLYLGPGKLPGRPQFSDQRQLIISARRLLKISRPESWCQGLGAYLWVFQSFSVSWSKSGFDVSSSGDTALHITATHLPAFATSSPQVCLASFVLNNLEHFKQYIYVL